MKKSGLPSRILKILELLKREYPEARCSLVFSQPHELLVATILSAQSTDAGVNRITPALFRKYKTPQAFAKADRAGLENAIKTVGLYRNKAKAIQACMQLIVSEFAGEVPREMAALVRLPGIGRKTANVILGNAFGIPSGIAVDTHVGRLSKRLGLTKQTDPVKIEADLVKMVPTEDWILVPHLLIWHGRKVCQARKPKCAECVLNRICPSSEV